MKLLPQLPYLILLAVLYFVFVTAWLLSACGAYRAILRAWDATERSLWGLFSASLTTFLAAATFFWTGHFMHSRISSHQPPLIVVLEGFAWMIGLAVTTHVTRPRPATSTTIRRRLV